MLNYAKYHQGVHCFNIVVYRCCNNLKIQPAAPKMINNGRVAYDLFIYRMCNVTRATVDLNVNLSLHLPALRLCVTVCESSEGSDETASGVAFVCYA